MQRRQPTSHKQGQFVSHPPPPPPLVRNSAKKEKENKHSSKQQQNQTDKQTNDEEHLSSPRVCACWKAREAAVALRKPGDVNHRHPAFSAAKARKWDRDDVVWLWVYASTANRSASWSVNPSRCVPLSPSACGRGVKPPTATPKEQTCVMAHSREGVHEAAAQCSAVQCSAVQSYGHGTAQHSTTQHSTAQHSTAQHNTRKKRRSLPCTAPTRWIQTQVVTLVPRRTTWRQPRSPCSVETRYRRAWPKLQQAGTPLVLEAVPCAPITHPSMHPCIHASIHPCIHASKRPCP